MEEWKNGRMEDESRLMLSQLNSKPARRARQKFSAEVIGGVNPRTVHILR
ncbi:hypothetical protein [Sulfitobacter dubius]|jgi:hypothetical protein